MSGQYPPPNPSHPFNRVGQPVHHPRAPPAQGMLPPWGHTPQPTGLNVGNPMNFYGSPHLGLPSRASRPWPQPKPLDTRPSTANSPYGMQGFGLPRASHPTDYNQEESMDLSSHASTSPAPHLDTSARLSPLPVRTDSDDPLRNGSVLPIEFNGELGRSPVIKPEIQDSVVTSVIATNPLRENITESPSLNFPRMGESSVVKTIDSADFTHNLESNSDLPINPQVKVDTVVVNVNDPVKISESLVLKTSSVSSESDMFPSKSISSRTFSEVTSKHSSLCESVEKDVKNVDLPIPNSHRESDGRVFNDSNISIVPLDVSMSVMENSSISVDTDESKLVVAESSNDLLDVSQDIDLSNSVCSEDKTENFEESSSLSTICSKSVPDKVSAPSEPSRPNLFLPKLVVPEVSAVKEPEPHPSVEILLESMFNSQEENSCSSHNSTNSMPQSVIVSNGAKMAVDVPKPLDINKEMKVEDLALTLAGDTPLETKITEEKQIDKSNKNSMDEIEKELEMITESSWSGESRLDSQHKFHSTAIEKVGPVKNKADSNVMSDLSDSIEVKEDEEEDLKKAEVKADLSDPQTETKLVPVKTEEETLTSVLDVQTSHKLPNPEEVSTLPKAEPGTLSNPFIEVETELEKMFAGIVESTDEPGSDISGTKKPEPVVLKKSTPKKRKTNSRRASDNSLFGGSSGETTPVKKRAKKRIKCGGSERGSKRFKTDSGDLSKRERQKMSDVSSSGSMKGPFVHIEGSKESPASVVVMNSGLRPDDDDGKDKASARRKHSMLKHSEASSRKAGPMYSSSAMSARYNSDNADPAWVCVFCKRGPHCVAGLGRDPAGDLFGPYRIPAIPPHDDIGPPGVVPDRELVEEQKRRGGKYPKSIRASGGADQFIQKIAKKTKRSGSVDSNETQAAGLLSVEGGYEVWLHGPCAEWAPGLCLIGSQLVGLEDAVWTALKTRCTQCGESGAGIACVVRSCSARVHYHCATLCDWLLDSETFIARCNTHRTRLRPA